MAAVTDPVPPTEPASDSVDTPAIGPPTREAERRHSPEVLARSARIMDASGARRQVITVVCALGHVHNPTFARELGDDPRFAVIGQCTSVDEAERSVIDLMPGVALIGLRLSPEPSDAPRLCATLRDQCPPVAIVAVGDDDSAEVLFECVRAGARSCFTGRGATGTPSGTLARVVTGTQRGESLLSAAVTQKVLDDYERLERSPGDVLAPTPELTAEEEEVLGLLAAGETPSSIADELEVTTRVVGLHAGHAVAKLHRTYHDDSVLAQLR